MPALAEPITREQRRSRRKRTVRKITINTRRLPARELQLESALYPERNYWRPRTRLDCEDIDRPCPYVGCKWHLYLDVTELGSIILNFPDIEPDEMLESCALDVAEFGGERLEFVGEILNMTRERVRQIEVIAMEKLQRHLEPFRELIPVSALVRREVK